MKEQCITNFLTSQSFSERRILEFLPGGIRTESFGFAEGMKKDIIQFSHANGFPAKTYASLFANLEDDFDIRYIDMLGHTAKYPVNENWQLLVDELIDAIQNNPSHEYRYPVIALGHSLGAAISFFAGIKRPDLFKALILLDAPIFALLRSQIVGFLKKIHRLYWVTPAGEKTLGRRVHWPSYEATLEYFRTRSLFKDFSESALHDFVSYGTMETEAGRVLKFDPKVEAEIYKTLPHNYSEFKHRLKVPTLAIIGEKSDISNRMDIRFMKKYFNIQVKKIPGGHLFPFEYPAETAQMIKASIHALLYQEMR